jgi:transcriptional regulator with XRE-family HTH domain
MNEKIEFAERLKKALIASGYQARPSILEKGFNSRYWGKSLSKQAVTRWLKGEAIPSQEKIQVLSEWLGVDPYALRFGDEALESVRKKRKAWEEAPLFEEREAIESFLRLPTEQKKIIVTVINLFLKANDPK